MKRGIRRRLTTAAAALAMAAVMVLLAGLTMPAYAGVQKEAADNGSAADLSLLPSRTAEAVRRYTEESVNNTIPMYPVDPDNVKMLVGRLGGLNDDSTNGAVGLYMMDLISDRGSADCVNALEAADCAQYLITARFIDQNHLIEGTKKQAEDDGDKEQAALMDKTQSSMDEWGDWMYNSSGSFFGKIDDYKNRVISEIGVWWKEDHSPVESGINVLYTADPGERSLTYSAVDYNGGALPDKADNGEAVDKDESFGVPGSCLDSITSIDFNADSYKTDFVDKAAEVIAQAANKKTLIASEEFYKAWDNRNSDAQEEKARAYARDLLNTVTFQCSVRAVNKNEDGWVDKLFMDYTSICSDLSEGKYLLEKWVKALYAIAGFEGNAKRYINEYCSALVSLLGTYGLIVMTVKTQDKRVNSTGRKMLRGAWVNAVEYPDNVKANSLTGHDNYCYPAGAFVELAQLTVSATSEAEYNDYYDSKDETDYVNYSADPWKLYDENGKKQDMSKLLSGVTHERMNRVPNTYTGYTYGDFLKAYSGCLDDDYDGKLMTEYKGTKNFALEDDLWMTATVLYGDYFTTGKMYEIVKPNTSLDRDCFVCHDKTCYKYVDMSAGGNLDTGLITARAAYMEYHWYWRYQEGTVLDKHCETVVDQHKEKKNTGSGPEYFGVNYYDITDNIKQSGTVDVLRIVEPEPGDLPVSGPLADTASYVLPANDKAGSNDLSDPVPEADWGTATARLNLYPENDPEKEQKLDDGIDHEIDIAVARAKADGIKVEISKTERKQIAAAMKETLMSCQSEVKENRLLAYQDVLGLEGNDTAELALAREVLPGTHLDDDGEPLATAKDMTIMAKYEPHVTLKFVSEDGRVKAVISPAFNIDPQVVVWDGSIEEYQGFDVSDEYLASKGLSLTLRVPVASAVNAMSVKLNHYNDLRKQVATYDAVLKTDAIDTYAEITADMSGTFELPESRKTITVKDKTPEKTRFKSLKKVKKGIKATWKKIYSASGYQIQYSTKKNFSSKKTVNIKKKSVTSKTIKSLKKGKKYYFRIRTYKTVSGKKYYSGWSKPKTVTTKQR